MKDSEVTVQQCTSVMCVNELWHKGGSYVKYNKVFNKVFA